MTPLIDTPTILIIDDTPSNLSVVVSLFESKGYRVAIAQDGDEGLQRARLVKPDLILLDVMMPGMDGFQACERLKTDPLTKDIPVIFMTALATAEHKVKGFDSGAVDYVTKPLQIDEVMARVETHLKLHAAQQRLAEHNEELERRVAERTEALAERERRFRTLAENLPDNLVRYDKQCRLVYMNQRLETLLGKKLEELQGKTPRETPVGEFYEDYQQCLEETIATGKPGEIELVMPDSGNGVHYHHVRFVAERDAEGEIVGALAIGRDITEHRQAERELQLLNQAVNNSSEAVFLQNETGLFVYVNEEACRSLGYSREELLTMSPVDIDPEITPEILQGLLDSIFNFGPSKAPMESVHRARDGRTFPIEIAASPIRLEGERYVLTMVRDISERKSAEAKLYEREQALSAVVENSPDTIVRYDRQLRRIYLNPAMEEIFGRPREQLLNTSPSESTPLPEQYLHALRNVLETGKEQSFETPFQDAKGRARWVDLRLAPEFGADGEVVTVLAIGRDITERKLAEDSLRKSDQRYRLVFENSPISIWEEDFSAVKQYFDELRAEGVTDIDDYFAQNPQAVRQCAALARIVDVNQAAVDLHEAKDKESLFSGLFNTFTPESLEAFRQELSGLWQGKTRMTVEAVVKTQSGELRNVTVHFSLCPGYEGSFAKVLVSIVDITERKQAELALAAREREFRTLAENIPDTIIRYDVRARKTYVNTAVANFIGIDSERLIGRTPQETLPARKGDQGEAYTMNLMRTLSSGEPREIEVELHHAQLGPRVLNVRFVAERNEQGGIIGALMVGHDITARKVIERELQESREQLRGLTARREEVREEERKYIAREVHDELGQILTGLKLNVSLLEHKFGKDLPALREHLKETSLLTARSLEVARNVASALRPASLDMGIGSALEWLAGRFENNTGISCTTHVDDGNFDLSESCAIALFRIAQESLTNIARHAQATHIEIELSIGQDDYTLKVRDNGLGFDTNHKKLDSFGVVGMRERATMLDGEFVIESQPGTGTQVIVRIPHKRIEGEI